MLVLQPYEVKIWGEGKDRPLYKIIVQAFSEDEAKTDAMAYFRRSETDQLPAKVSRIEVLSGVHLDPKKRQQSLFEDLAEACINSPMDDVQGAAVNLLLTSVQRRYIRLSEAETRWDELLGRGKEALRRRFTGATDGRDATVASELGQRLIG